MEGPVTGEDSNPAFPTTATLVTLLPNLMQRRLKPRHTLPILVPILSGDHNASPSSSMASLSPPLPPSVNPRTIKGGAIAASWSRSKAPTADGGVADRGALAPLGDGRRPWWAPLFRTVIRERGGSEEQAAGGAGSEGKGEEDGAAVRRSGLTAEKARVLRREMRATETWHDAMYHSSIASRLASPDQP